MPGRASLLDISGAKSDIAATRGADNGAGISGMETSMIGGAGRKGGSGEGGLSEAPTTRVDTEFMSKINGMATGGEMGYDSGSGRTFKK